MDRKEQNWNNFYANHLKDWHGLWVRYGLQGEVIESFQSLRSLRGNEDGTVVTHANRYVYSDGRTEEKSWQYHKPVLNSFFFERGAAAWAAKKLEDNSPFWVELFFRYEQLRLSVVAVYDESGNLVKTANIREDAVGFPSQYWSEETKLLSERKLSGNWEGTAVTMTPDLQVSPPAPAQLQYNWEGNETFFYPDGISLSYPRQLIVGNHFSFAANWLVTSSELQQLIINYDDSGAFYSLTHELFCKSAGGEP